MVGSGLQKLFLLKLLKKLQPLPSQISMKRFLSLIETPGIANMRDSLARKAEALFRPTFSQFARDHFLIPINDHKAEDVFVVGYPKSGNTWMQSIVSCLKYGIDPEHLPESLAQELVPDVHAKKYYKRYGQEMAFKSHFLPNERYRRVLYLVRDGRDVMASYLGMYQNMQTEANIETMIKEGRNLFPCKWHKHIAAWRQNPFDANIDFVKYEDLLNDPVPELHRICDVFGLTHSRRFLVKVADGNRFDRIKERASKMGTANRYFDQRAEGHRFFRKGKIGSYQKEIPKDLIFFFEEEARNELSQFGYLV